MPGTQSLCRTAQPGRIPFRAIKAFHPSCEFPSATISHAPVRDGSGSTISVSTKGWDILHQGAKKDIIGDYDFRNRVYSPTLGRWLSNDPIGFSAGDVNTFRYVGNGPEGTLDPLGLEIKTPITNPQKLDNPNIKYGNTDLVVRVGIDEEVYRSNGDPVKDGKWITITIGSKENLPENTNWMQIDRRRKINDKTKDDTGWYGSGVIGKRKYVAPYNKWIVDTVKSEDGKKTPYFAINGNSSRDSNNFTIVDQPAMKGILSDGIFLEIFEAHALLLINGRPVYDVNWIRTGVLDPETDTISPKYNIKSGKPISGVPMNDSDWVDFIKNDLLHGGSKNIRSVVQIPGDKITYTNHIKKEYRYQK